MQIIGYKIIPGFIADQICFFITFDGMYDRLIVQESTTARNVLNHIPKMTDDEFNLLNQ